MYGYELSGGYGQPLACSPFELIHLLPRLDIPGYETH